MAYQVNLTELLYRVWGKNRPIYAFADAERNEAVSPKYQESNVINLPADSPVKSTLGTVVLSPVEFQAGSYKQRVGTGKSASIVTIDYTDLMLPPTTLLEVTLKKVIVKTPLVSGQGTFKEYISLDDYDVRIRGVYVGQSVDEVATFTQQLMQLWSVPKEIEVACDYLNRLDISALVIENIVPQQLEGRPLMLPFEMSCISDKPLQLNFLGSE